MSHHLRHEKNCLNCGTEVLDRYCPHCGQENVEPKESAWHLFVHFFNDITHFEGKFFRTVKLLITKPGFLSEEYMKGRRAAYVNPIRLYLFVSFVLFFLRFSLPEPTYQGYQHESQHSLNETSSNAAGNTIQDADTILGGIRLERQAPNRRSIDITAGEGFLAEEDSTVAQYDARQAALPESERDGWIDRWMSRRLLATTEYYLNHKETFMDELNTVLIHSIPKMLFISIPLFAILLWLLYVRSRNHYYFVTHGIFTIHLYCAIFLIYIVLIPLDYVDLDLAFYVKNFSLLILPAFYLYKSMRKFYMQKRVKTIFKFILLMVSSAFIFGFLLFVFAINAFLALGSNGH